MTKPTPEQVVVDSLVALDALTAGADVQRTADAMGLPPAALRFGLTLWAAQQRHLGLIDEQRYAELLRLASSEGKVDPTTLRIVAGHLVEDTGECDCSGADLGVGHELECGLWPLMTVVELAGLISGPDPEGVGEVTANGLTIYGRIASQDGSEVRVQQSAVDGCARIYGTVHVDVEGARTLRKALDAFIHDAVNE